MNGNAPLPMVVEQGTLHHGEIVEGAEVREEETRGRVDEVGGEQDARDTEADSPADSPALQLAHTQYDDDDDDDDVDDIGRQQQRQTNLVNSFRDILNGDLHRMDEYSITGFPDDQLMHLEQALHDDNDTLCLGDTIHLPLSHLPAQIIPELQCLIHTSPFIRTISFRGFRYSRRMDLQYIRLLLESMASRKRKNHHHHLHHDARLHFDGNPSSAIDGSSTSVPAWRACMARTFDKFEILERVHVCCENVEFVKFWMSSLAQCRNLCIRELSLQFYGVSRFEESFCTAFAKILSSFPTLSTLRLSGDVGAHVSFLPILTRHRQNNNRATMCKVTLQVYLQNRIQERSMTKYRRPREMQPRCSSLWRWRRWWQHCRKRVSPWWQNGHGRVAWQQHDKDEWETLVRYIRDNPAIMSLHIDGMGWQYPTRFVTALHHLLVGNSNLRTLCLRNMNLVEATVEFTYSINSCVVYRLELLRKLWPLPYSSSCFYRWS